MRKGSAHLVIILVVALGIIGGLVYYALTASANKTAQTSSTPTATVAATPTPVATHKTVTSEELVFDVPVAWTEVITDPAEDLRLYTYASPSSGDYAKVTVSTIGTGDSAPVSVWHYKLNGKTLVPVQETADCDPTRSMCSKGNGALLIGVTIDGLDGQKINQRIYDVSFGNTKSETSDRQIFRDIMKTAHIK